MLFRSVLAATFSITSFYAVLPSSYAYTMNTGAPHLSEARKAQLREVASQMATPGKGLTACGT